MPELSFNLTFDDTTEQKVIALWQHLADEGITVRSLTGYRRPHITLSAYQITDTTAFEIAIEPVVAATEPFLVRMESLGIFPESGAVVLTPRMSLTLFSLHRTVVRALDDQCRTPPLAECLLPDSWMPHCTLASGLDQPQMLTAIQACQRFWTPIRGQAVGIALGIHSATVDYRYYPFLQQER